MVFQVTFGDKTPGGARSAIAKALLNAAEDTVNRHKAEFDKILQLEWLAAIGQAGLGTSRAGTSKDRVTPIREAIQGEVVGSQFPLTGRMIVAPDAEPKINALSGQRGAHVITGHPLIFPGTNDDDGRTIFVPEVNWRPSKGGFLLRPILVLERAKRAWARRVSR